ncbi:MAG: hypothetical protein SOU84_03460 [Candidatus Faecimonas sp.]|nr:hypothetical protein [Mycoplasmatota bacterium]MDY2908200.1 hypothetical protein [Candidatus Faecimonas sp.]
MNKQFHPIRAFIIIFVLSLLIILPPLFRLFFPKIDETKIKNNDKITLLTCTRNYAEEQITETVEVRYINSKVNQTKITYSTMAIAEYSMINGVESDILPSIELSYFQSLSGVAIEQKDSKTIVTINQDTIDRNPSNQDLKENYFNDKLLNQKIYFTNRYFQCDDTTV